MTLADTALAKLAQASRIFQLGLRRAAQNRLWGPLRWLGAIIAKPMLKVAAMLPIARAWWAPVGPADEQARSVERAAATSRRPDPDPKLALQKRARGKCAPAMGLGNAAAAPATSSRIDRNPSPAWTDLTMDGPNRRQGTDQAKPEKPIWLEIDELIGQGLLQPGARRVGVMNLRCGTLSADYEADMVDPANAWLRLRFCTRCPPNGYRRVVDQRLALVAEGSRWRFLDRGELCEQLVLRFGGFRRPRLTAPRPPSRPPRPPRPPAQPRRQLAQTMRVRGQIWLQIDELIGKGRLQPGALRRGVMRWWHPGVGACTAAVAFEADLIDRTSSSLRLRFWNTDRKTGRERMIEQQVVLAKGAGEWWFIVNGQIHERLGLRRGGTEFRPPQPVGSRRKLNRQRPQDKSDGLQAGSWSRDQAARRLTKLVKAKLAVEQFLVGIFDRPLWQAGILPIAYAALTRIATTWQRSEHKMRRPLQALFGAIVKLGSRLGVLDSRSPAV
jgi:hypothetical protein